MIRLLYIARYLALAVWLLLLQALAPAMAQNVVSEGSVSPLSVEQKPGDTYTWELYDTAVDFAQVIYGNCPVASADFVGSNQGASVQVLWKKAGDYFFKVTARDALGCTNNIKIGRMKVEIAVDPNQAPLARNDVFTARCSAVSGNLFADNGNGVDSDPDVGDLIFAHTTPVLAPAQGSLILNADGTFVYRAKAGFSGTDQFRYTIFDQKNLISNIASVTIHVIADFDGDGIADGSDPDADGDGILNVDEAPSGEDWHTFDSDNDGHPNWLDIDSDNDGIVDNYEAQSTPGYVAPAGVDSDNDGINDAYDPDQGGVRIIPVDTDGDGTPDFLDLDSDQDGVPDRIEGHDSNSDGKPDRVAAGTDADQDGLDDAYDTVPDRCGAGNVTGSNAPMQDFDGDGLKDWRDENDDDDQYLTRFEDLNGDGDFSNDDVDFDGHPEYLDYGRDCDLFIPNAFSPNGDDIHDYFQIYCINHFPDAKIYIFDQVGNKLFEKDHYGNLDFWGTADQAWWDGTTTNRSAGANGNKVAVGTYYYVLKLGNGEVKKSFVFVSY